MSWRQRTAETKRERQIRRARRRYQLAVELTAEQLLRLTALQGPVKPEHPEPEYLVTPQVNDLPRVELIRGLPEEPSQEETEPQEPPEQEIARRLGLPLLPSTPPSSPS
jgi:hypothetical protein